MKTIAVMAFTTLALSACANLMPSSKAPKPIAVADLKPTQGNDVTGTVTFLPKGEQILVDARVKGLKPGAHGFHIHEKGDCSAPDAKSAGEHFNPTGKPHGSHNGIDRHAGDLGNLIADADGNATLTIAIPMTDLSMEKGADDSIGGRAVIVHADPDDYKTQPSGASGARLACGVIGMK